MIFLATLKELFQFIKWKYYVNFVANHAVKLAVTESISPVKRNKSSVIST
jgi:hypothetical protein